MTALLDVRELHAGYGATPVLFGIDLTIQAGEAVTLLGRNGMGKTTTVRSIFRLTRIERGEIRVFGESVGHLTPDRVARMGIALVPEGRRIFPNLTVEENLRAFIDRRNQSDRPWTLPRVLDLFPVLAERTRHLGNRLSGGEQQMLAIARALVTNPHLLILDEATEGLGPLVRDAIWEALAALRTWGQTLLVIDKHIDRLCQVADRHVVIERGHNVWSGTSAQLRSDPAVLQRYLGVGG